MYTEFRFNLIFINFKNEIKIAFDNSLDNIILKG